MVVYGISNDGGEERELVRVSTNVLSSLSIRD